MVETFFTQLEAKQKLGRQVRSLSNLGSVPEGTQGTVVKVIPCQKNHWTVRVRWQLPQSISLIDAADFSFFKRDKPAVSDLSKSVYENSIEEIS